MLFTGWEVRIGCNQERSFSLGVTVPLLPTEGTVSPHTDQPRPVNNIFIIFKFQENFTSASNLHCTCVVGRVRVDEARDRLQNMIFSL